MPNDFWVSLSGKEYHRDTGWDCSALTVPGARLKALRVGGTEEAFRCDAGHVRLARDVKPPISDGKALIALRRRLFTVDTPIAVALIALLGTVITAYVTYNRGMEAGKSRPAVGSLKSQFDRLFGPRGWFVYPDGNNTAIGVHMLPASFEVQSPFGRVSTDNGPTEKGHVSDGNVGANVELDSPALTPEDEPSWQKPALKAWREAKRNRKSPISRTFVTDMFGNPNWNRNSVYRYAAFGTLDRDLPIEFPVTNVDVNSRKVGVGMDPIRAGERVTVWLAGEIPD